MDRTPIPERVNLTHLRALIRQNATKASNDHAHARRCRFDDHRGRGVSNRYDSATRRQRDGAKARKPLPPNVTLANAEENDLP
jgi:hypothetical protein